MYRFALLAMLLFLATPAMAQEALAPTGVRTLHSAEVDVKGPDGSPAVYRFSTTYDPVSGVYTKTVVDVASGAVVQQDVSEAMMVAPTPAEAEAAEEAIRADPELAALIASAEYRVEVSGGFPLLREAEAGFCGPGSRCAQYDIFEVVPGEKVARRIRYVVIDLRDGSLVSRDLDPTWESNFANPAIRQNSRARDVAFPHDSQ